MIALFKEQNQKNKGDTLHRLPAKVVSNSVKIYVGEVTSNGTTDSINNKDFVKVKFIADGQTYERKLPLKGTKTANPTLDIYVYSNKATQEMYATQNKDLISKYLEQNDEQEETYKKETKDTYNGKEIIVDNTHYARVQVLGYENLSIILPNKTNTILAEGDDVWVHYWNDISAGYIFSNNLVDTRDKSNISFVDFISSMEVGSESFKIGGTNRTEIMPITLDKIHKNPKVFITVSKSKDTGNLFDQETKIIDGNIQIKLIGRGGTTVSQDTYTIYYLIIDT